MTRRRFRQRRSTTSPAPAQPSAPSHQLRAPSLAVRPRDRVRRPPRTHRRFVVRSVDVASYRDGVLVGPDGLAGRLLATRRLRGGRRARRASRRASSARIRGVDRSPPRWSSATTRLTSARPPTPSSAPWASAWSPCSIATSPTVSAATKIPIEARRRTLARMLAPRRLRRGRRRVWHGPQRRSRRLPRIRVRSLRGGRDARAVPRPGCRRWPSCARGQVPPPSPASPPSRASSPPPPRAPVARARARRSKPC